MLFAPTTKPASPFTLECLSPLWACLGLNLLAFPFMSSVPMRPSCRAASFPCRAELVPGKKSGMKKAERIGGVCAVTLTEATWHVTTRAHPLQWVQELPVDGQDHTTSVASISSLQPGLCDHSGVFMKSCRGLSGVKFCLADVFIESMSHSAS